MNLLIWVLQLLDGIFGIFRQLAGLENVRGTETDLISLFLNNDWISKIFFGILIIGVVVAAISVIVAIIKAFVNLSGGERKSIIKITGQGIGTIFISLLMAGIMVSGITIANSLLRDVDSAFHGEEQHNICNDLFEIGVEDRAYYWEAVPEFETYYDPVTGKDEYKLDSNNQKIPVYVTDQNGDLVLDDNGNPTPKIKEYIKHYLEGSNSGWTTTGEDAKKNPEWSILDQDADSILGKFPKDWMGLFEQPDKTALNQPLIHYGSFNFLLAYFAAIIVLVAVASACLGLVKRIYDIVILFLSLPLIVSTIPLDDGARFKVWRETVVSKVVIAYGAVFAVNVFITMVPIITSSGMDKILQMILIVGGGLSISGGILLFARLFGTDAAESRDLAQSARTLLAGGMVGAKGIKMVGGIANNMVGGKGIGGDIMNSIFGSKNPLTATASVGTSALSAGSSLTPAAMPGSNLGEALRTAGVQSGTWAKDPTTGRFVSSKRAQELLSGATKKINK